jgi:hypothetical protein
MEGAAAQIIGVHCICSTYQRAYPLGLMTFVHFGRKGIWTSLAGLLTLAVIGCGDGHGPGQGADAGSDGSGKDAPREGGCRGDASGQKTLGQTCACASDCATNFCVDGVCCNTACTESCKTCAASTAIGICTFLSSGTKPRDPSTCSPADVKTCGLDGTCDGAGACRRFPAGTLCKAGTCDGDAVVGALVCDGAGRCKLGPEVVCAPFSCDPTTGACFDSCTQSNQCVSSQQCVNTSCGKKMKGATCKGNADCASGFCADKVCCNVACQGGCVSCTLSGRTGTCWPVDTGVPDPRAICKDQGAPSCGTTGACDGFGSCEKYAAETECIAPTCTGIRRNTSGTCDGLGTCRPQGVQNCSPFRCVSGDCNKTCLSDANCEPGHACVKGLCGPKTNGQACSAGSECLSTFCVDGLCCDTVCTGGCRSCTLPSMPGKCTSIPVGNADPRGVCQDQGSATCSTNGKCDGSGSCQKYKMGTICAPEICSSNVYTPRSTCSATGQCTAPDSLPCSPYACNGTACFVACTANANCLTPNVCNGNSCGKKIPGSSCSAASECQSNFCAQGVCCNRACTGACESCTLSGSLGTCTNVLTDSSDPAGTCTDQGSASCGTNGKCQAGACQRYGKGTSCKDSTCPSQTTMFTPGATCDGAGACVTPAASSCFPYSCGVNACKGACAADGDCATPAVCINGSCGLKGLGKTCADGTECLSQFCTQGVCCNSACNGTCQSCALSGLLGMCSSVPNGSTDPQGTCNNQGQATCGTDGVCDGRGACRMYAAGTQCLAPSCPAGASTLTQARTCDGVGHCQAPTTIACAPFKCNGTSACNAACTTDADCQAPDICDPKTNLCGNKKRLGQACASTDDCLTGNTCVDGVCCTTSSCPLCQSCAVTGFAGACANVPAGTPEPKSGCLANPPCGNTGNCNGGGACQQSSVSASCGIASCTGSAYTPVSHCTGSGTCAVAPTTSCSPYVCGGGACKTVCTTDIDCVAPFTCQGSGSTQSCALKPNGPVCTSGDQCISGNCIDGVCCGSSSCPSCQACNVAGNAGTCSPLAAGSADPKGVCADKGVTTCGTNGKCDGASGCQEYADGTGCSTATCPGGGATLTSAGTCSVGACSAPTQSCSPYFCNGTTACRTTCDIDNDCAAGYFCTGAGGTCTLKTVAGASCTAGNQCGTGNCVDGVCCGSATCGSCQACNVAGNAGTCSPLAAGAADPKGVCMDNGAAACGANGKCDGAGGCQKYPNGTTCSQATCADTSTLTLAGTCSNGSCSAGTQSCSPFLCNAGACGGP